MRVFLGYLVVGVFVGYLEVICTEAHSSSATLMMSLSADLPCLVFDLLYRLSRVPENTASPVDEETVTISDLSSQCILGNV